MAHLFILTNILTKLVNRAQYWAQYSSQSSLIHLLILPEFMAYLSSSMLMTHSVIASNSTDKVTFILSVAIAHLKTQDGSISECKLKLKAYMMCIAH